MTLILDPPASKVASYRWPELDADSEEVASQLAGRVVDQRGGQPASVAQEESLQVDAERVVGDAMASPQTSGLSLAVATRMANDPAYRRQVVTNTMILASHLHPLSYLIYGADLEDVTCLAHDHWVARIGGTKFELLGSPFESEQRCIEFFRSVLGLRGVTGDRAITDATPVAEANVGSVIRISVAIKPALSGASGVQSAIRIPARSKVRTLDDYVNGGVIPRGAADFLHACVMGRANIMVAGGTSTGKTTLLRVLCGMVQESDQIVVIEDGAELHIDSDRGDGRPWVRFAVPLSTIPSVRAEAEGQRLSMMQLVRHALRFNPDRIVLGESRGEEMAAVCKALMTGHDGSMTTIHAETALLALDQATQYVMENARFAGNENIARRLVHQAIHVVVHMASYEGRRRLTGIVAVEAGGNVQSVYELAPDGGWQRGTTYLGDLTRLASRLRPFLPGNEVPLP